MNKLDKSIKTQYIIMIYYYKYYAHASQPMRLSVAK